MSAYYNEIDPYAAQWLRNLISAGHIAPGDVDERDIRLVRADDLRGYIQCHFFAGIGVWSYALRQAGWPDDEEIWTGSCPCQPFSAAGAGEAFDDERDLWPDWFTLLRELRPRVVAGEQVASPLGLAWLDALHADLEGEAYTVGAIDTCSAGFGSPNIRQRLYWVADADEGERRPRRARPSGADGAHAEPSGRSDLGGMAEPGEGGREIECAPRLHADGQPGHDAAGRCQDGGLALPDGGQPRDGGIQRGGQYGLKPQDGGAGRVAESASIRHPQRELRDSEGAAGSAEGSDAQRRAALVGVSRASSDSGNCVERPGPLNGFWRNADWLCCTDGKWRPVEPGTFPLVTGAPSRLGRLRAYGNAINAQVAAEFIRAYRMTRMLSTPQNSSSEGA